MRADLEELWQQAKPRTQAEASARLGAKLAAGPAIRPSKWENLPEPRPVPPPVIPTASPPVVVEERKALNGLILQRMSDGTLRGG